MNFVLTSKKQGISIARGIFPLVFSNISTFIAF